MRPRDDEAPGSTEVWSPWRRSRPPSGPGTDPTPWHDLYLDVGRRTRHTNAAKAAVARKVLIAAWHTLSRNQPFKPAPRTTAGTPVPASCRLALAA